jgi:hypothetical protein
MTVFSIYRRRFVSSLALAGVALGLVSCKLSEPVSPAFKAARGRTVAVILAKAPEPNFVTSGGQGLLDMAITSLANSPTRNALKKINVHSANEALGQTMAQELTQRGYRVTHIAARPELMMAPINQKDFAKSIRTAAQNTPCDYVLGLRLIAAQIDMPVALGIVPVGSKTAQTIIAGLIVDKATGEIAWFHLLLNAGATELELPQSSPGHAAEIQSALTQAISKSGLEISAALGSQL